MIGHIVVILFLIFLNGLFTACEVALLSLNVNKIKDEWEDGSKRTTRVIQMLERPDYYLSAIQICISITNLYIGIYAAETFIVPVQHMIIPLWPDAPFIFIKILIMFIIALILSYIYLLFGELTPKRIGMRKPLSVLKILVRPMTIIAVITIPISKLLSISTVGLYKLLKIDPKDNEDDVTEEEIRMMVNAGAETGSIDENEIEMIHNIFEFDDKTAGDISVHRRDIVALSLDAPLEEIIDLLTHQKFSRIPVYEDNIDNIIGILYVKDILQHIVNTSNLHDLEIRNLLRKPYFVPFSNKTDALFEQMQKNKVHMAVVVDEYGGTYGIVTMEDIIEEIMGSILDEYDEEEIPDITVIDDNTFTVNGSANLDVLEDYLDVKLPLDDYDTVGGFVIGQLGRVPSDGENPEIEFNGVLFKVVEVAEKRILSITVCKVA